MTFMMLAPALPPHQTVADDISAGGDRRASALAWLAALGSHQEPFERHPGCPICEALDDNLGVTA